MTEEEVDVWEDAYEIERVRRLLEHLNEKLAKKAEERGISETQLCGIRAAMKLRVEEDFKDSKE